MNAIRVAILTVSDRCSRGEATDETGPALQALVRTKLGAKVVDTQCVPDEAEPIQRAIRGWVDPWQRIDLILTAGGTGLAPRDRTPEAVAPMIERPHAGLMELARLRCYEITPRAFLSRGIAGAIGKTLVLTLPGSIRGATEQLGALLDILPHAIETIRGEVQDDGRSGATPTSGKVVEHDD